MASESKRTVRVRERGAWQLLGQLTHGNRMMMSALASTSFLGAMLEAGFLVMITSTVMALASGNDQTVRLFGGLELSVNFALWAAVVAVAARLALGLATAWVAALLGARVRGRERRRVARSFLRASWGVQQDEPAGRLQELMTSFVGRVNQAMTAITQIVTSGLSLIAFMAASLFVDPVATVAVLLALGVLGAFLNPVRNRIRATAEHASRADIAFATTVAEAGSLGREMQTFGVTDKFISLVDVATDRSTALARTVQFLHGILAPVYTFLAYLAVVGGVAALQFGAVGDLASLGAVMLLMLRSLSYGQQLMATTGQLVSFIPSIERVDEIVATYQSRPAALGSAVPDDATPLSFKNVSFSYTKDRPALRGLTFDIHPGEMIGVVGPSGAGKSTIAQLVLGVRPPSSGSVTIAGVDLNEVDREWWTRVSAFVPQDPLLFTGTVAENIRFHRQGLHDDALTRSVREANVLDDIERLPENFQTHLGERGSQLSGGQRQRLSIARALVGRPKVLVMDEPTSALDGASESLIRDTLASLKGRVTIVLIAHRMSTLDLCDRIMVIEDGRITGLDTPESLRRHNAFYRDALHVAGLEFPDKDKQ